MTGSVPSNSRPIDGRWWFEAGFSSALEEVEVTGENRGPPTLLVGGDEPAEPPGRI